MTTSDDKFRKLLAAYEDEVQRKQHKMGKKVDPKDEVQPNPSSGYCTFIRAGQQVIWSPSFDVIGTYEPSPTGELKWAWGWADQTLEPRIRTRIDGVRKQAVQWGIEMLTTGLLTLPAEQNAWELSIVATAVARADAMYRTVMEDGRVRFLALFDGPPPSRSTSMRPGSSSSIPAASLQNLAARTTPYPGLNPALAKLQTNPNSARESAPLPQTPRPMPSVPPLVAAPGAGPTQEPTERTRAEIAHRLYELVPPAQTHLVGTIHLVARAMPPAGPVGSVALDLRVTLKPNDGGGELVLSPSGVLYDALIALWQRCREQNAAAFRFLTARLESGPQGMTTQVFLEF